MKKKILSLVLVVAMLASMLVLVPASGATQKNTITVGRATGVAGDVVSVDVVLTSDLPVYTFQFALDYDKTKLELLPLVAETEGDTVGIELPNGLAVPNITAGKTGEMVATSPYQVFGWSRNVGAKPLTVTSGYVIATLNFKVLAGALGDAYVSVCETPLSYFDTSDDTLNPGSTFDIEYVSGAVTVLPEGYGTAINVPESAWDFEEGVIYGITDESIVDATGALVIPSQIGGVDVVEIAAAAFDGYSFSTLVIPETVEFIAGGAVYNCSNLTKAYVLGAETELEEAAIGYEGSWRSGKLRNPAIILNADETGALTTIYGAAGSTAETYANTGDGYDFFPFVAEGICSVTFGGNTYLTGTTVQAPGVAVNGDELTVAWKVGDNTYGAGELMTLEGPVTLEPVTITKPTVNSTLGFKIGEDEKGVFAAMRFTTNMAKADYETLAGLGTVTMGTLITPARYVSHAGALTREALDQLSAKYGNIKTYVDVTTNGYLKLENGTYTFAGSLKHIQDKNVDLTYAAAFYLTVETANGSFTVYSDFVFANNRDAYSAAKKVADGGYVGMTEPQIEVLDDFIADCATIIASRENN